MSSAARWDPVRPVLRGLGVLATQRPRAVLAALLVAWVASAWLATHLEVRASFIELLPEDERPVRELREVLAHARSASDVVIAIPAEDRELAVRFARALTERMGADERIDDVGGHVDPGWFLDRRLLYAPGDELDRSIERLEHEIDGEILARSGLYLDLEEAEGGPSGELLADVERTEEHLPISEWAITRDGRYLALWAHFAGASSDLEGARASWDVVREIVDEVVRSEELPDDFGVRYAGGIPVRVAEERALVGDLQIAGSVGFVCVVLLIVAALRAPRALVLLAIPLLIGLTWTFAFARLAVGHLNIISGFLFSILSGLGIEYGIHLLHGYRERRDRGEDVATAVQGLVQTTGRALVAGSLTNASVFGVIAFADFRGFSEFGLIAAVGLVLTLASTLLGLPALLVISERIRPMRFGRAGDESRPGPHVPAALRLAIVVLVPVAAIASIVLVARGEVPFDGNWRVLAGDSEQTRFGEYLRDQVSDDFDAAVLWLAEPARAPEVVRAIEGVGEARRARGARWDVVDVRTIDDYVPPPEVQAARIAQAERLGAQLARIRPEWLGDEDRRRLEDARRVVESTRPFLAADLPETIADFYRTSDGAGTMVHITARAGAQSDTSELVAWAEQVREITAALDAAGLRAPALSENWVAGEVFERIGRDAGFLSIGTLAAVFLVLLLDLRRPFAALAVLGAVLLGVGAMAGGMWLTGVRLNFMNSAILPVCIGISLDNAIHVYHRWREEGPGSIPIVLRHTTVANALSSATNLLGFGTLVLTHHEGLRSVAFLATLGVLCTYATTTLWFPMVLATLDARAARRG